MYNQQNSSSFPGSMTAYTGAPVSSQYRGSQRQYQPVGTVQSQYGQGMASSASSQFQSSGMGMQGVNSFHTASYRGNQPGHDSYLRSDSPNPSSMSSTSFASGQAGMMGQSSFGSMGGMSSYQSPNSFHTANYRGNQQGHDNYLRADSTNPSSSFGFAGSMQSQYQPQSQYQASYASQSMQSGYSSPQSFHTASYRGNQSGHDNYLRADSTQPSGVSSYRF